MREEWRDWRPLAALLAGLVASLASLAPFADLAEDLHGPQTRLADDLVWGILRVLSGSELTRAMLLITFLGDATFLLPLVGLVAIRFARRGDWTTVGMLFLVGGGGIALNLALKGFFQRGRPTDALFLVGGYSFPSGHAMLSLCVYGFLTYLALRSCWRPALKVGAAVALGFVVLAIGLSRLYLGVHWATDVGAGYLAGAWWLGSCIVAHESLQTRGRRRT